MSWNIQHIRNIYCFGDSLTAGYGTLPGYGWVEELQRRHRNIHFYDYGLCGAGMEGIIEAMEKRLSCHTLGDGYFLMGGTNDILGGLMVSRLEGMVQDFIEKIAKSVPLVLGIPPLATEESVVQGWQAEYLYQRNQEDLVSYGTFLLEVAERYQIPAIDFSKAFPLEDAWYSDGLHPNQKGYAKMADAAERILFYSE